MAPKKRKKSNSEPEPEPEPEPESEPESESDSSQIIATNKTYNKKLVKEKAKLNTNFRDIQMLFHSKTEEQKILVMNAIEGNDQSELAIDQFAETFCNDHVKCTVVLPTILETMSIPQTNDADAEYKYFVRTSLEHSWLKWVTVKHSLLIKDDEKMMGLFADRRFSRKDYIGVYLGKFDKKTDPHKGDYAYQLGNLDAETGLGGKPYMGMHYMNDPNIHEEEVTKINVNPNAVGWLGGGVTATTSIIEGEEFLLDYQGRRFKNDERKKRAKKIP